MTCFWVSHNLQSDFSSFLHILVDMSPSNGDPGLSLIFFWDPKLKWNTFDFPLAFWKGRWLGRVINWLVDAMGMGWDGYILELTPHPGTGTNTRIIPFFWIGNPEIKPSFVTVAGCEVDRTYTYRRSTSLDGSQVAIDWLDLPSVSTTLWEKENYENHPLTYRLKSQKYMTWQRQRDFGTSLHINQWE